MDQIKYIEVMRLLGEFSGAVGVEARREKTGNGTDVLSFLSAIHENGEGLVYFQLGLVQVLNAVDMVQIVTTVLPSVGQGVSQLERAAAVWSRNSLLGSYGISDDGERLWHRCCLPLEEGWTAEETAAYIQSAVTLIYEEIARHYDCAQAMASGGVTLETAQERGLC